METRGLRTFVVMVLVMGMVGEKVEIRAQTTPSNFQACYELCFLTCMLRPNSTLFSCSVECLRTCLFPIPPALHVASFSPSDVQYYCKLVVLLLSAPLSAPNKTQVQQRWNAALIRAQTSALAKHHQVLHRLFR